MNMNFSGKIMPRLQVKKPGPKRQSIRKGTLGKITYDEAGVVRDVVAENNEAIFIVIYAKLDIGVDSEVLITGEDKAVN